MGNVLSYGICVLQGKALILVVFSVLCKHHAKGLERSAVNKRGFTLVEILVVMTIIGLLASVLSVSVQSAYKQARQAHCKSNLRQFGVAATIYRGEHNNEMPDWLSNLYPEYIDDRSLYVCRADKFQGKDTPRPKDLIEKGFNGSGNDTDTPRFWDNEQNQNNLRNRTIEACSYLYEFSAAETSWWVDGAGAPEQPKDPKPTMKVYKMAQMQYGDSSNLFGGKPIPYSASHIPIVRCYHHWKDMKIYGYADPAAKKGNRKTRQYITLNVAYAGNVFVGPTWWEGTIRPGESSKYESSK